MEHTHCKHHHAPAAVQRVPASSGDAIFWTCPMHAAVRAAGPGSCPFCGMALERSQPEEEGVPDVELQSMQRRLLVVAPLAALLVLLDMGAMFSDASFALLPWIELALATPVVLWGAAPFFRRGFDSIRLRSPNMFTLIALGTGTAYLFSLAALISPAWFPSMTGGHGSSLPLYFEASAVIVLFVLVGQVLELRARARTGAALRALLQLAPKTARRVDANGEEKDVPVAHLQKGSRLRVRPGERIAADGIVVSGHSDVDEATLTGEPMPVEKELGAVVRAGTTNGRGTFEMTMTAEARDSLFAQVVRLVAEAQRTQAPIQRLVDRVSGYFVPFVLLVAVVAAAAWFFLGPAPSFSYALSSFLTVLLVACPCALGLATPLSLLVATGRGATRGIVVRNAATLERFAAVDTVVFDKTGTLTEGRPTLEAVVAFGRTEGAVLAAAAAIEKGSEHPLAQAVVAGAAARGVGFVAAENFRSVPGRGVVGTYEGRTVRLGNERWLEEEGIAVDTFRDAAQELRAHGKIVVAVALDREAAGLLAIADAVRTSAADSLAALRAEGIDVVLATGDHPTAARLVAERLGISEIHAGLLPQEKGALIDRLRQQGRVVAMVGDGVNDAVALARADVGVALGTGTDLAVESAGLTLLSGDLRSLVAARRLSRATLRNVKQNLFLAFGYNAVAVPVAAGVLYPLWGILPHAFVGPMAASAAMSVSSLAVVANALRLRRTE